MAPIKRAHVGQDQKVMILKDLLFFYDNGFQILNSILMHDLYVEGPLTKAISTGKKLNGI